MKKHGAELVFTESSAGGFWKGRLLNPDAIDRVTGKRARNYRATVTETALADGTPFYDTVLQGSNKHARRYGGWYTLTEAQAQLIAWARRRFYVEVES